MTTNSVRRSVMSGLAIGKGLSEICGTENKTVPSAMQTMGSDRGGLLIANGNHATSAMRKPIPVSTRM